MKRSRMNWIQEIGRPIENQGTTMIDQSMILRVISFLVILSSLAVFSLEKTSAQSFDSSGLDTSANQLESIDGSADLSIRSTGLSLADELQVGIVGRYRLGQWCAIHLPQTLATELSSEFTIETLDGDGVPVEYVQSLVNGSSWAYAIAGAEAAPLMIKSSDQTRLSTRFPEQGAPARQASVVPFGMPWVVVIGDPLEIDTIGQNELLERDAQVATSIITQAGQMPDRSVGIRGVDLMVINASGIPVLSELSAEQGAAIVQWVQSDGGELMISLGELGPDLLQAAPWLLPLLPFTSSDLPMVTLSPTAIETYTSSQTRLNDFRGVRLPRTESQALITGRTTRRVSSLIAGRYLSGLGKVTIIGADLEGPVFKQWPQRLDLVTRLNETVLVLDDATHQASQRVTGFTDLAGQVRATLDQFPLKRAFSFSLLSLLMMGFILLIGPLDYLFINRVMGKPLLGWLTLPLIIIAFSVLLSTQAQTAPRSENASKERTSNITLSNEAGASDTELSPATNVLNRLEIIDLESTSHVGRGFSWSFLYSHQGGKFDISAKPSDDLRAQSIAPVQLATTPFGFAGPEFGGIQIQAESGLPRYRVNIKTPAIDQESTEPLSPIAHLTHPSTLLGLPIAPRSSKSFGTTFSFSPDLDSTATVKRRGGSDLLEGHLVNPLSVDLLDGLLVYQNWAYLLPTRFPSGSQIEALGELRQRNFRWYLTRQKTLDKNEKAATWDPANYNDLQHATEILMFHDVVGASRYTGLQNGPLDRFDLSSLLADDRCILIGRLAQPLTEVQLSPSIESTESVDSISAKSVSQGNTLSMVRVVLPVIRD